MKMTISKICKSLAITAFATTCVMGWSATSVKAADVNFKGKTVTIWMPSKSVSIRLFLEMWAEEISKNLPGNPKMIVKGKPGGGGLVGINFLYNAVKPDGLAMGYAATPAMIAYATKARGVKFDPKKMPVLGIMTQNWVGLYGKAAGIKGPFDIPNASGEMTFAARTKNHLTMTATLVMAAAGVKFKVVEGFGAPPTMFQAMSSGEVKMAYTSFPGYSRVVDNLNNMKIFPWFQYGNIDDQGNVTRDSLAKDVPTAVELFEKFNPAGIGSDDHKAVKTAIRIVAVNRTFWLPPKTDQKMVDAWRNAVKIASASKEFRAKYRKKFGAPFKFGNWQQAEKTIKASVAALDTPYFLPGGKGHKLMFRTKKKGGKKK